MTQLSEIRTKRLRLIQLSPLDAGDITQLITDWDVIRMLARPPYPFTIDDARGYLAGSKDRTWEFAIYGDRFMGVVGITDHLGYWLGKPFWGHGYMTEVARALVDAYFNRTSENKVISGAFVDNPGSQSVLRKLGFTKTGLSKAPCPARNVEVDHIDMALTRRVWRARHAAALDASAYGRD